MHATGIREAWRTPQDLLCPTEAYARQKSDSERSTGLPSIYAAEPCAIILSKKPAATAYGEATAIYSVECLLDNRANAEREAVQDEVIRGTVFERPLVKGMEMQSKLIGFSRRRVRAWIFALLVFAVGGDERLGRHDRQAGFRCKLCFLSWQRWQGARRGSVCHSRNQTAGPHSVDQEQWRCVPGRAGVPVNRWAGWHSRAFTHRHAVLGDNPSAGGEGVYS